GRVYPEPELSGQIVARETRIVIVGAGILGLATARAIRQRWPAVPLALLEKERVVGFHQTGHNSGVIHSGVYYRPRSIKARLCVAGRRKMLSLLDEAGIPYDPVGKVIVATDGAGRIRLAELARRAAANGVEGLRHLGSKELRQREPEARGLEALLVPGTAI